MNPIQAWNRFWFGPISALPLGVYRVIFGVLVLAHLGLLTVDLDHWYTDAGLLRGDEARMAAGPLRISPLQYVQDPRSVRLVVALVAAAAVGFVVGWRTRVMSVLLYLGLLSLYHRNIATNCGPDMLMMITSFYLMLTPCGAAFSIDAWRQRRQRGGDAEPLIIPWAQRLLQIQLCLIYFDTALLKCTGTTWTGGTAIHYVLFNHEVGQLDLEWLARYPLLLNVLTHAALVLEFALAFLLWFRASRRWVAAAGVLLHLGIVPLVNVPLFGEQMTALYLLFFTPEELRGLTGIFKRWRRSESELAGMGRLDMASSHRGWHQLRLPLESLNEDRTTVGCPKVRRGKGITKSTVKFGSSV
jgi:hypothetical protein